MTLHDWIDELCDALDIEAEVDEGLILDLARDVDTWEDLRDLRQ